MNKYNVIAHIVIRLTIIAAIALAIYVVAKHYRSIPNEVLSPKS